MFRRAIKKVKGLSKWVDDPYTNGKIRKPPIRGTKQPIAKTRESLVLIPFWRGLKGFKDITMGEIVGRASHAIDILIGTGRDLGRGGYNYRGAARRWTGKQARRVGKGVEKGAKKGGKSALKRTKNRNN